jgi:DNA-binding Lrp family transcriptional regulator
MAVKAIVMINTAMGKTNEFFTAIEKAPGVKEAYAVSGPYDVIAIVEAEDLDALGPLITRDIHSVSGITKTLTCIVLKV